jgi:penicillin-binding protein 2
MNENHQHIDKKLAYILYLILFGLVLIVCYTFHLQINLVSQFFNRGQKNFLRTQTIASVRGSITDCKGRFLATNRPVNTIYWKGTYKKNLSDEHKKVLSTLSAIIHGTITDHDHIEEVAQNLMLTERKGTLSKLFEDVDLQTLARVFEQFPDHPNIIVKRAFKRYYPYDTYASHLVGYLGHTPLNSAGKMGLEMLHEPHLQGKVGKEIIKINSSGRYIETAYVEKAESGSTLCTTIDLDIQRMVEDVFPSSYSGACIIMDPETGALKALLSAPSFNPNIFLQSFSRHDWNNLIKQNCFINRTCNACYPPASLFKLITLVAALEENVITPDQTWQCKGFTKFGNRKYRCGNIWGHGELTTQQALAKSCNIPFFEIGKKLSIDTLAHYAHMFGLGEKTSVKLIEKAGLVPTSEWKRYTKGERWWPGETLSAVIGQSFLLTTPLQIATMMSSFCTGHRVTPRILVNEPIINEHLPLKPSTLECIQNATQQVIKSGTARRIKKDLEDFDIHAKTGTAQTSSLSRRKLSKAHKEHAWFTAYFTYKNQQPLVIVVLIEHAGSARIATNTAANFLKRYKKQY